MRNSSLSLGAERFHRKPMEQTIYMVIIREIIQDTKSELRVASTGDP
jgi:hypothetical protein